MMGIKCILLSIMLTFILVPLNAQIPVTDGANAGLNAANLKVNTATMNASVASKGFLETAKKVAEKTFDKVSDLKKAAEGLLEATNKYQEALRTVNTFVANSSDVKRCFEIEKLIVKHYYESLSKFGPNLRGDDQRFYRLALKNGLNNSVKVLDDLSIVLKPSYYSMTDRERLAEINGIRERLDKLYTGQRAFVTVIEAYCVGNNQNKSLQEMLNSTATN